MDKKYFSVGLLFMSLALILLFGCTGSPTGQALAITNNQLYIDGNHVKEILSLNDLKDVNANPISNDALIFDGNLWRAGAIVTSVTWGTITGNLENQTDLNNALSFKANKLDIIYYDQNLNTDNNVQFNCLSLSDNNIICNRAELTGPQGPAGQNGSDGTNGTNGLDGNGVPTGGNAGQILAKLGNEDFNTHWIDNNANVLDDDSNYLSKKIIGGGTPTPISNEKIHYKMNDNAGTYDVIDSSGNNFNGTSQQITSDLTTTGKINEAINFNGSSDYISLPDNTLNLNNDFTISAWVKLNSSGQNYPNILGTYDGATTYNMFAINSSNQMYFDNYNIGEDTFFFQGITDLADNQFHLLTWDKNSDTITMYADGIYEASHPINNPNLNSNPTQNIGRLDNGARWGTHYLNGIIDDLRIYDKSLNKEQIDFIYNSGNGTEKEIGGPTISGLVAYYRAEQNTNDLINNNNGVWATTPSYSTGILGDAFNLNGSSDYITSNNILNNNVFSTSLWFKESGSQGNGTCTGLIVLGSYNSDNSGVALCVQTDNTKLYIDTYNTGYTINYNSGFNIGEWYNLILTSDGTYFYTYLNGNLLDTTARSPNIQSGPTYIGHNGPNVSYFNGLIDEVAIFNKTLSSQEVSEIYNSGLGIILNTSGGGTISETIWDANYLRISNLKTPTDTNDATNKGYVDKSINDLNAYISNLPSTSFWTDDGYNNIYPNNSGNLIGNASFQTPYDKLKLGREIGQGGGNFFIDNRGNGALIFGNFTPKGEDAGIGGSPFQFYSNEIEKYPMLFLMTQGTNGQGSNYNWLNPNGYTYTKIGGTAFDNQSNNGIYEGFGNKGQLRVNGDTYVNGSIVAGNPANLGNNINLSNWGFNYVQDNSKPYAFGVTSGDAGLYYGFAGTYFDFSTYDWGTHSAYPINLNANGGNVWLGQITDDGTNAKLQVNGNISQSGNLVCDNSNNCGYLSNISGQDLSTANNSTSQFITLADIPADNDSNYRTLDNNVFASDLNVNGTLYINGNIKDVNGLGFMRNKVPYGVFSSTKTQTIANSNLAYVVDFNTTEDNYLVNQTTDNNFSVGMKGDYMLEISLLGQVTTGNNKHIDVWFQKNGVNIPRSNTKVEMPSPNVETDIVVPFIIDMDTNDSFRVMWASDTTAGQLLYTASQTNPTRPEIPSAIITIHYVGGDLSG